VGTTTRISILIYEEFGIVQLNVVRGWINNMKKQVLRHVDPSDQSAQMKGDHYIRMLDAQLITCDQTEDAIDKLT
jgi:hypothetical protein